MERWRRHLAWRWEAGWVFRVVLGGQWACLHSISPYHPTLFPPWHALLPAASSAPSALAFYYHSTYLPPSIISSLMLSFFLLPSTYQLLCLPKCACILPPSLSWPSKVLPFHGARLVPSYHHPFHTCWRRQVPCFLTSSCTFHSKCFMSLFLSPSCFSLLPL